MDELGIGKEAEWTNGRFLIFFFQRRSEPRRCSVNILGNSPRSVPRISRLPLSLNRLFHVSR
jgi:hypothetical protein